MRRVLIFGFPILAFGLAGGGAFAAGVPALKLLGDFQPGLWQMTPLDDDSRMRLPQGRAECILSSTALLRVGATEAGAEPCSYTVIEDAADRATVTYVCRGAGSGRTSLRRVGGAYRIDAQGFAHRQPFEMTAEYKRLGNCSSGGR